VASDSRALTLKLLADTADFQKKLQAGSKDIDSIGERAQEFGKKAAIAFAAAAAAIGAFALDAVKAAAEEEKAQKNLEATILATTNATQKQVEAVGDYITQTSISIGVTDDQLRPAFERLVRTTGEVEASQRLLNLALDLSAASGKPVETVAIALAKAYDGNTTALGKLGLGIDENILKSGDFDLIAKELTATWGNFAENEGETAAKKMERIKIAMDEAKEAIGLALLPILHKLTDFLLQTGIPILEAFVGGFTGDQGLTDGFSKGENKAAEFGNTLRNVLKVIIKFKDEFILLVGVLAAGFVVSKVAAGVQGIILLIGGLVRAYNLLKTSSIVAGIAQAFALNPLLGAGAAALAVGVLAAANAIASRGDTEIPTTTSTGNLPDVQSFTNSTTSGTESTSNLDVDKFDFTGATNKTPKTVTKTPKPKMTLIEEVTQANFLKNLPKGDFDPSGFRSADERNIVINVNAPSAIDEEGFTRAVVLALNNSNSRTGAGAQQLSGL